MMMRCWVSRSPYHYAANYYSHCLQHFQPHLSLLNYVSHSLLTMWHRAYFRKYLREKHTFAKFVLSNVQAMHWTFFEQTNFLSSYRLKCLQNMFIFEIVSRRFTYFFRNSSRNISILISM